LVEGVKFNKNKKRPITQMGDIVLDRFLF